MVLKRSLQLSLELSTVVVLSVIETDYQNFEKVKTLQGYFDNIRVTP